MNLAQRYAVMGRKRNPLDSLGPKLALHLESDFGVVTVAGRVSEWASRAGWRNTVVQATHADRPTLVANVLDGKPAIRFASGPYLQSLTQVGIVAGDLPRIYIVGSYVGAANVSTWQSQCSYSNNTTNLLSLHRDTGFIRFVCSSSQVGASVAADNTYGTNNAAGLFEGRKEPAVMVLTLGGLDRGSFALGGGISQTPNRITVGALSDLSWKLNGDIFSIIVLTNPTPDMHAFVIDYLRGKYPSLGIASVKPPVDPLMVDYWHSELGVALSANTVQTWTSQIRGDVMGVSGVAPTYGPDGSLFNKRSVIQATLAGGLRMMSAAASAILAAGTRPYIFGILRQKSAVPAGQVHLIGYTEAAASIHTIALGSTGTGLYGVWCNGGNHIVGIVPDTKPHVIEGGFGATALEAKIDGLPMSSVFGTSVVTAESRRAAAASQSTGDAWHGDSSLAFCAIFSAKPSDAYLAQLYDWASRYWDVPARPPLPASAVEYWHSELGVTLVGGQVDSWTGQLRATLLSPMMSPTARPDYASDPGYFGGRVVVKTAAGGQRALASATIAPALVATGARPYHFIIARNRSGGVNQYFSCFVNTPIAGAYPGGIIGLDGTGKLAANWYPNGIAASTMPGTAAAAVETYIEAASGTIRLRVGGAEVGSVGAGLNSTQPVAVVEIGGDRSSGGFSDVSMAFCLLCSSQPSAAEVTALMDWAQSYWRVPISDRPPLPANAVEYWCGHYGASAASAVGQKAGITLTGFNAPTVAPDGSYFAGRPVYQSTQVGGKTWQNTSLADPILSGARPWLYVVLRARSPAAGLQLIVGIGGAPGTLGSVRVTSATPAKLSTGTSGGGWDITGPNADALPHIVKTWVEASTAYLHVDGVQYTSGGAAIPANVTGMAIGSASGGGFPADASVAFFLICSAKPTAAEEAALDAWAKAFYGLP